MNGHDTSEKWEPPKLLEGANKYDQEKTRLDLVPPEAIEAVGRILTYGAKKYAPRNWEQGIKYGRVFGAALRHMWAWWRGEDLDPETGMSHLWHAATNLLFLVTYTDRRMHSFDDRPTKGIESCAKQQNLSITASTAESGNRTGKSEEK